MKKLFFPIITILAAWAVILPVAIVRLCGRIWSVEGFWRFQRLSDKAGQLAAALLLAAVAVLLVIQAGKLAKNLVKNRLSQRGRTFVQRWCGGLKWLLPAALVLAACGSWISALEGVAPTLRWFERYSLVAHAGGGVGGKDYTNSLEAFQENYQKGYRVFEGDLCFTSDGALVLQHDWPWYYKSQMGVEYVEGAEASYEEFMSSRLYGTYTPMDLTDVMELMTAHEDMYFMTDFKDSLNQELTKTGFQQIVDTAREMDCEEVLDRFIIQVYHAQFKIWVESVYPFENYLYTCYMTGPAEFAPEVLVPYCRREDVPVLTMWTTSFTEEWRAATEQHNIHIYVHTENDAAKANQLIEAGVSGVYTDYITDSEILTPAIKQPKDQ